ncbi:MAG: 7-carboxy-7-deazaguanine synthase QueE [bacterium]
MKIDRNAYITEIFQSIEGEGLRVGILSIFIKFAGCNLACPPCDTKYSLDERPKECSIYHNHKKENIRNPISIGTITEIISKFSMTKRLVLTGGEPLLQAGFIEELAQKLQYERDICVETNSTLPSRLARVITYISEVSCDVKPYSVWGVSQDEDKLRRFLKIARKRLCWVKCVIKPDISLKEIEYISRLVSDISPTIPLIFHPLDLSDGFTIDNIRNVLERAGKHLFDVRFLPRIHKVLKLK